MRVSYGTFEEIFKTAAERYVDQLPDEGAGSAGGIAAAVAAGLCHRFDCTHERCSINCHLWCDHDRGFCGRLDL